MKVKLPSSAVEDMYEGRLFYEKKGGGLGEYFFDSLFSDIDSLTLYAGIHAQVSVIIACCLRGFHTPSTTEWKRNLWLSFGKFWTRVVIRGRSGGH